MHNYLYEFQVISMNLNKNGSDLHQPSIYSTDFSKKLARVRASKYTCFHLTQL